jgi:tetratricopeptide (TPR) repeat protein
MAEAVRPETETHIGDYLRGKLSFSRVMGALRSLRSLNLIVVKPRQGQEDVLELHPLVREFIRRSFPKPERIGFIEAIIQFYSTLMGGYKPHVSQRLPLAILQNWTETAELYVEAGKYQEALDCLAQVRAAFSGSDFPGEFVRSARIVFRDIDWRNHEKYKSFDAVFTTYSTLLANLGRTAESTTMLDRYAETVKSKDARFINYCNLRCYAYWMIGNYAEAIVWGQRGKELKSRTNVDTTYSTDHNLALAQRDSGIIDPALTYFLAGRQLTEVLDLEELDEARGGPHYGNIGRCLHLMGQIDPAIICYRKSAILLERETGTEHVFNQGFARKWIGELLIMRSEFCIAKIFLEAAKQKWLLVSPPRAREVDGILETIKNSILNCPPLEGENIERFCVAWIFGRETDFQPI